MSMRMILGFMMLIGVHTIDTARADSSTAGGEPVLALDRVAAFAKQVERTLAARGARVALVARVGRSPDELPDGIRYTHVGFAVYSAIGTEDGRHLPGYVMYNLYQRADRPDRSDLVRDMPADFFSSVSELRAGILIPSPELQQRLLAVIASATYADLHDPHYSVVANPYTLGRQNCTEHTLDVINAAIYDTPDKQQLKQYAKAYFKAQPVEVNPLRLMLGTLFMAEVSVSDQGDTVETASFGRIRDYLDHYGLLADSLVVLPAS